MRLAIISALTTVVVSASNSHKVSPGGQYATFLLNFFDELRRRLADIVQQSDSFLTLFVFRLAPWIEWAKLFVNGEHFSFMEHDRLMLEDGSGTTCLQLANRVDC
jgi:hypothetical protein